MGPQCEGGYTKIANELLEALCRIRIPGESMQIFLVILRKTYGYKKLMDKIALSQFVELTGMKKPNVCRSLKQLQTLNVIQIDKIIQNDNVSFVTYRINKLYETWEVEKRKQSRQEPLSKTIKAFIQNDNAPLSKTITNVIQNDTYKRKKETTTKENITKDKVELLEICKAWKAFVEMRNSIKKPMTSYAMGLRVKDLFKLQAQGNDPIAVLNQSIASNYQDLYPLKGKPIAAVVKENKPEYLRGVR